MTVVELCAGAGGLALGLSKAGFHQATLLEWDPHACATVTQNIDHDSRTRHWRLFECNVTGFDFSTLGADIDLLAAGLPCQPFSVAGKGRAHQDRRDMFCEVVRAARELRPKAILIENVKGLVRSGFRDYFEYLLLAIASPSLASIVREDWKRHLGTLRDELRKGTTADPGYTVHVHEINSADYGVPQWRERVLIVAFRNDLGVEWSPLRRTHDLDSLLWSQWMSGDYWRRHGLARPRPNGMTRRVARRLRKLQEAGDWQRGELLPWVTVRDAIADLPTPPLSSPITPNHFLNPGARIYERHSGSQMDEPAKTLKAGNHGVPGGENTLVVGPGEVRYFTIRECARLQTFPDYYTFSGPWSRAMRQVGNAVPVELGRVVGNHIGRHLAESGVSCSETVNESEVAGSELEGK